MLGFVFMIIFAMTSLAIGFFWAIIALAISIFLTFLITLGVKMVTESY